MGYLSALYRQHSVKTKWPSSMCKVEAGREIPSSRAAWLCSKKKPLSQNFQNSQQGTVRKWEGVEEHGQQSCETPSSARDRATAPWTHSSSDCLHKACRGWGLSAFHQGREMGSSRSPPSPGSYQQLMVSGRGEISPSGVTTQQVALLR